MQIKPPPENNARRSKRFENEDIKTEVSNADQDLVSTTYPSGINFKISLANNLYMK